MLKPGDAAPDFSLPSDDGRMLGPGDFAGKRLVLYFYPKDNTSGCTTEAQEFQERLLRLKALNAEVVGVSRDGLASHAKFREKYGLTFPLLSDPEKKALAAYGAWGEKSMYGKAVEGTIRTTVVVDPKGRVERVYGKVRAAGHAEEVLKDLAAK